MARRDASDLYGEEHVRKYRETGGEYGHDWRRGSSTLLLTTKGRRSGEARTLPLIYGKRGDDLLVVASNGGSDAPPSWYENLRADPEAEVQVLEHRFKVHARDATPEEKPELWRQMSGEWPPYDDYQQKTDREIPVVVLERAA
jgi:deazaflavin-dependent oxidoreductase (nitroreductase family)